MLTECQGRNAGVERAVPQTFTRGTGASETVMPGKAHPTTELD